MAKNEINKDDRQEDIRWGNEANNSDVRSQEENKDK